MKKILLTGMMLMFVTGFAGCVTSTYTNKEGQACTRKYFTPLGIPFHSCSESAGTVAAPPTTEGTAIPVASAAPSPSLSQTAPAQTIKQSIKATTQALR